MVYLNSEIDCSPSRVVSDVKRFQRNYVPLNRCLDMGCKGVDKASTTGGKGAKKEPKWKAAFKDLCESYGEAWMQSMLIASHNRLRSLIGF